MFNPAMMGFNMAAAGYGYGYNPCFGAMGNAGSGGGGYMAGGGSGGTMPYFSGDNTSRQQQSMYQSAGSAQQPGSPGSSVGGSYQSNGGAGGSYQQLRGMRDTYDGSQTSQASNNYPLSAVSKRESHLQIAVAATVYCRNKQISQGRVSNAKIV